MRGDVYDVPLALPGTANSRLCHHAFSVASEEYIAANGATILISSTTGSRGQVRPPFAFFIADPTLYRHEQGRAFDVSRPITPTLLAVKSLPQLPARVGTVGDGFFTGAGCRKGYGALDALSVQLQLPARMSALAKLFSRPRDVAKEALRRPVHAERLSVWRIHGDAGLWVVVSNDKNNCTTGFVLGLKLQETPAPFPQTALEQADHSMKMEAFLGPVLRVLQLPSGGLALPDTLSTRVGKINPSGATRIDAHLEAALGLP